MALEMTLPQFRRYLNGLPKKLVGNTRKLMEVLKVVIRNDVKESFKAGVDPDGAPWKPLAFPRPNGKTAPLWDTGRLLASINAGKGHVERKTATTLEYGTNLEYAALQHYGGVVKPVNAKFLSIPLTMAAKRAGSPRQFPGKLRTVVSKRTRKGVLIGAEIKTVRRGRNKGRQRTGKTQAQYALVKQVTIPPRPFLGFGRRLLAKIEAAAAKFMEGNF